MPGSAWNNNKKRKRPASKSCIAEGPYLPSKRAKTVPASNPSWLEADQTVCAVSTEPPVIQSAATGQDWAKPVRRAQSAPSEDRGQVQEQDSDGLESQPLPRECFSGTNDLFPGPRAQEAIVAPLTRQALQHLNRTNNQSSSSAASLSMSSEVSSELLDSLALDEPKGTINAYKPKYVFALEERGIYFADDEPEKTPSNLDELTGAIFGSRAPNEYAIVQSILPKIIPIEELSIDSEASTVPEQQWHRKIMIDPNAKPLLKNIKPDRTVGWSKCMFECPRALKYLDSRACPVASNPGLAWPLFTAEFKGDKGDLKVARLQNLHNGPLYYRICCISGSSTAKR
ncbi:hypothetical protein ABVK25_001571 [Lepraria finkii]|uniref:DUF7924 domain-containing protein n=1 Tax=Lepraria finkii TaxID=1340010 RepID=A0ABR4BJF8_9LECA